MKKIQIFAALIVAILVFTTACERDSAVEYPLTDNDSFTINLSLGKLTTRAVTTEPGDDDGLFNENKINSLDIFFYEGSTLKWKVNNLSYDEASKKATIPILAEKRDLFVNNTTTSYDIYVVANNTADLSSITEGNNNLQALKDVILQTSSFTTTGGVTPQTSFVMDGMISKVVDINNPEIGTVNLKRAAAKIRLKLINVAVPGYTQDGDASARLVHFTDKAALMDGGTVPAVSEWKDTSIGTLTLNSNNDFTTATPFYAYANDWSSDVSRETFLELFVPLKDGNNETNTYMYRVPVSLRDIPGDDAQYLNKLQRNFLYEVSVSIKILGSISEVPVEVSGNYIIKDWGTQEILVDIKGSHYLVVSERNVIMPNLNSYTLTFNSSIPDVTLVPNSLKATFTYVNTSGVTVTENATGNQIPTITVQSGVASGNILINSTIPVNYIPKDIEFKITNGQLTETVNVRQLPATYFTVTKGVKSYMIDNEVWGIRNSLPSGNNNPYMYAITSLAPAGDIIWGFPPLDDLGQTINSEEVSRMISPKFEMASQFGSSLRKEYEDAQEQCSRYIEWAEDGTEKKGWRLPTAAEIHYIDIIQQTAPTEYVMRGAYYWSSWSDYPTTRVNWPYGTVKGAYKMGVNVPTKNHNDSYNTGATYDSAHVRCIRDIKN